MPYAINFPWLEHWLARLATSRGAGAATAVEPTHAEDVPDALRNDLGLWNGPVDSNRNEIFWRQYQRLRRHGLPF